MWDTLTNASEGTSNINQTKIYMLVFQYEMFKMKDHESIDEMFGILQTIINNLRIFERTCDK